MQYTLCSLLYPQNERSSTSIIGFAVLPTRGELPRSPSAEVLHCCHYTWPTKIMGLCISGSTDVITDLDRRKTSQPRCKIAALTSAVENVNTGFAILRISHGSKRISISGLAAAILVFLTTYSSNAPFRRT